MDLPTAAQLAQKLMAEHKLDKRGWTFAFNRRKQALGICNYTDKRIELSTWFVMHNDEPAVRDTVLHEIAHAKAGPRAGHGPKWRAMCLKIGALPQRTCSTAAMPRGVYVAQCQQCGHQHHRHRRPARGSSYYCVDCGPKHGALKFERTNALATQRANNTPAAST